MSKTFTLSVVAPDRTVVETEVTSVIVPGVMGYLGVLVNHSPIITALQTGLVEYRDVNTQKHFVAIDGGFMETDGQKAIILADSAELAKDIDVKEAEEALERARRALRGEDSSMTAEQATAEIERAMNRIKAARIRN